MGLYFNGLTISLCVTGKYQKPVKASRGAISRLRHTLSPAELSSQDRKYVAHAFKHGWLATVRSFQWIVQGHAVDGKGLASNWWAQRFIVKFSPGMDRLTAKTKDSAMRAHLNEITEDLKKITTMPGKEMTRKKFNAMLDVFLARF